jgi:lipopolysaccharide transport system permease protein
MKRILIGEGIQDFIAGFINYAIWSAFAMQDIKSRYRRSYLGPLWITINMGIIILALGPIYSTILHQSTTNYIPNLSIGFIFWGFISNSIVESCNAFKSMDNIIKQISLPFSTYLFKNIYRNIIVLVHNFIIIVPIIFIYSDQFILSIHTLFFIPIFILVLLNLFWMTTLLAIICTRYSDMTQFVANAMQIIFFLTPIIWTKNLLSNQSFILDMNIFFHMIECMKLSLLGQSADSHSLAILLLFWVIGSIFTLYFFSKTRKSISFWV